jgi:hypothetical protein
MTKSEWGSEVRSTVECGSLLPLFGGSPAAAGVLVVKIEVEALSRGRSRWVLEFTSQPSAPAGLA